METSAPDGKVTDPAAKTAARRHRGDDVSAATTTPHGSLADGINRMEGNINDKLASCYSAGGDKKEDAASLLHLAEESLSEENADAALLAANDALALYQKLSDGGTGTADALRAVIGAHRLLGDADQAMQLATQELDRFTASGDLRGRASMLFAAAEVYLAKNRPQDAVKSLTDALELFRELKDIKMEASVLLVLTGAQAANDEADRALVAASDALAACRESADSKGMGQAWHARAAAHLLGCDPADAIEAAGTALQMAREAKDHRLEVNVLQTMSESWLLMEQPTEARRFAMQALSVCRRVGYEKGEGASLSTVVHAEIENGDQAEALQEAKDAVSEFHGKGNRRGEADAQSALIHAHLANRQDTDALGAAWEAMELRRDIGDRRAYAKSLLMLAMLHLTNWQNEWALQAAENAMAIYQELQDRWGEGLTEYVNVHVYLQKDAPPKAMDAAHRALAIFKETGSKRWAAITHLTVCRVHQATRSYRLLVGAAGRAQSLFEEKLDKKGTAAALLVMAEAQLLRGHVPRALRAAGAANDLMKIAGFMKSQAVALHMMAGTQLRAGENSDAEKLATESKKISKDVNDKVGERQALVLIAEAKSAQLSVEVSDFQKFVEQHDMDRHAEDGDGKPHKRNGPARLQPAMLEKAEQLYKQLESDGERVSKVAQQAIASAKEADDKELQAVALHSQAQVHIMLGNLDDALESLREAVALSRVCEDRYQEAVSLVLTAEVYRESKNVEAGVEAAQQGLKLFKRIGDEAGYAHAERILESVLGASTSSGAEASAAALPAPGESVEEWDGLNSEMVRSNIAEEVMGSIGLDELSDDVPLMDAGLDSLSMVEFRNRLNKLFSISLPASVIFDFPNVRELTGHIVDSSKSAPPPESWKKQQEEKGKSKPKAAPTEAPVPKKESSLLMRLRDPKVTRPCVVGTWNNWVPQEMDWDADRRHYRVDLRLGNNGWESFQILYDGEWKKSIYPNKEDASTHDEAVELCGPDDEGHGKNWTVGKHPSDKGSVGVAYTVRLTVGDNGAAEKVDWVRSSKIVGKSAEGPDQPFVVGTWNNWGPASAMTLYADSKYYQFGLKMGSKGWESFQILYNGEWKKCLHPNRCDGCPYSQNTLCGPDDGEAAHGKNWTIGRHPLDKGGPGVGFYIRLVLNDDGSPAEVSWIRQ